MEQCEYEKPLWASVSGSSSHFTSFCHQEPHQLSLWRSENWPFVVQAEGRRQESLWKEPRINSIAHIYSLYQGRRAYQSFIQINKGQYFYFHSPNIPVSKERERKKRVNCNTGETLGNVTVPSIKETKRMRVNHRIIECSSCKPSHQTNRAAVL